MELGERIKQARLDAGLSQRALCGDRITRNMLSQIEHGTARPSMQTLQYLAERLEKPVSFFLEESAVTPNQILMAKARQAYSRGNGREALLALEDYAAPDGALDWEFGLLGFLCCLEQAEKNLEQGRRPVAEKLLSQTFLYESPYITPELRQRRDRLSFRLGKKDMPQSFPPLDEELLRSVGPGPADPRHGVAGGILIGLHHTAEDVLGGFFFARPTGPDDVLAALGSGFGCIGVICSVVRSVVFRGVGGRSVRRSVLRGRCTGRKAQAQHDRQKQCKKFFHGVIFLSF